LLFLSIPFRNLWRRPIRSCLTAMGVAVAVATLIALVGVSQGVERAWSQSLSDRGIHMLGFRKNAVELLSSTVDQAVVEKIGRVEGVKVVSGELIDLVKQEAGVIRLSGWPVGSFLWETLNLSKGRLPGINDPNGVVLGQRLADRLGLSVGDTIPLLDTKIKVVGMFHQASILTESAMVLPLPLMQKLMDKGNTVTVVNLRLFHPENVREVAMIHKSLDDLFPGLSFFENKDLIDANEMVILLRKLNWSVSLVAMLMGLFFVLNTLLMSVNERTREIGILSSLGWRSGRIMAMIMFEGMFLTALGSVAGMVIGLVGLQWLASLKYLKGFFDPVISAQFMFEVFLAATILGIVGSFYPAWRTSRLRAVEALKEE
jgi:putative ABC transport system permease protein